MALGLRQEDMAAVIGVGVRTVLRLEARTRMGSPEAKMRLAHYLALRGPRDRLKRSGTVNPFAGYRSHAVRLWNATVGKRPPASARSCALCGELLWRHERCRKCALPVGGPHGPVDRAGLCAACSRAVLRKSGRRSRAA